MEVILKMTVTMIFMGTWTWTKNREMKEKVGVVLRNNFVHTGRAPKGLTIIITGRNGVVCVSKKDKRETPDVKNYDSMQERRASTNT